MTVRFYLQPARTSTRIESSSLGSKDIEEWPVMRQFEQTVSDSWDLISPARASLERDKKMIKNSINLMARSDTLLKQLSLTMELQQWLEASLS